MHDESGAVEQIAFLARSEARVTILTHLLVAGPTTRRAFREELNQSRSTVTRALSALSDCGYVEQDGGSYSLTPQGRLVSDSFADLVDTVQATEELGTFLRWFPYSEFEFDIDHLRDGEVTVSTEADPYAPARQHAEALADTPRGRQLLPSIDLQMAQRMHDRVLNAELDMEILLSPGLEETVSTEPFAPVLHEQVADGSLRLFVCEQQAPFYLGLTHDLVQIGVEDDEGFPRALLETDSPAVREWAEDVYASFREQARPKPPEEL